MIGRSLIYFFLFSSFIFLSLSATGGQRDYNHITIFILLSLMYFEFYFMSGSVSYTKMLVTIFVDALLYSISSLWNRDHR